MIVLADGTLIYDEYTLRDVMEKAGFDCWHLQKGELAEMLRPGSDVEIDSLQDRIDELESEVADLESVLDDRDDEIDELKKQLSQNH